ncbi:hypothetical protein JOQ06_026694, partial [Pogonophryne albipinna]
MTPQDSLRSSASASVTSYSDVDSDDTIILQRSPASTKREEDSPLAKMIEDILKNKPGGERIMNEYARTKSLTDVRRRDMVKILVAQMTSDHGTSPSRRVKEEYAKGITSLFPNLANPRSKFGFEHYYNAEDGSGYLAWRLKFVQKGASEGQKKTLCQSLTGGPKADRGPFTEANCLTTESLCCEAIALMKHSADEAIIEQDFHLLFGDVTSAKFLEKWPTVYKKKVLDQSRGLTQTGDLQDLVQNAGSTTEVENDWDQHSGASGQHHGEPSTLSACCGDPEECDSQDLVNVYNFLQTTIYEIDVENTKVILQSLLGHLGHSHRHTSRQTDEAFAGRHKSLKALPSAHPTNAPVSITGTDSPGRHSPEGRVSTQMINGVTQADCSSISTEKHLHP